MNTEPGRPETAPPLGQTIWRGIVGRCPDCGKGRLFSGFLNLKKECDVCGRDFRSADAGDGPAIFVMLITGFVIVGAALYVEVYYQPSYWVHALLWLPLGIVLPLAMLRPLKGLLLTLQYRHQAAEGRLAE
ncbi:hypothetical protein A7A08_01981 [Methyloligella halotolerans]|uniref:DUF983 domain-containing protein n=1 Tax=Methyloligella halotolerans TaxID=1177755 RepID=A0A1E2RYD9_9HYPH|nr:DUF983 domain-containing protein [Methyloligella halotolerans]ODA67234.1 hypothetical protein A7A08_01981 [Methyloligella halotolerans]